MDDLEFIKSLNVVTDKDLDGDDMASFIQGQKELLRAKFKEGKVQEYLQRSREEKLKQRQETVHEEEMEQSFTQEIKDFEEDVPVE